MEIKALNMPMSFYQPQPTHKGLELMVYYTNILVNTEGRVQMGLKIVEPPGHSRDQWEIFRALS
jgi:hypothetical protein